VQIQGENDHGSAIGGLSPLQGSTVCNSFSNADAISKQTEKHNSALQNGWNAVKKGGENGQRS